MDDDGVGGLLRVELELLGQLHADPLRLQQRDDLRPVLQVGAGRVAERVAAAAEVGGQDAGQVGRVVRGQRRAGRAGSARSGSAGASARPAPRSAAPTGRAPRSSRGRRCAANSFSAYSLTGCPTVTSCMRDDVEPVGRPRAGRSRRCTAAARALAREGEPGPLGGRVLVQHDERVALGVAREVAVHDGRLEHLVGDEPVEPVAHPRPALGLDQLLIGRSGAAAGAAQAPLAEEGRPFVEHRRRSRPAGCP